MPIVTKFKTTKRNSLSLQQILLYFYTKIDSKIYERDYLCIFQNNKYNPTLIWVKTSANLDRKFNFCKFKNDYITI